MTSLFAKTLCATLITFLLAAVSSSKTNAASSLGAFEGRTFLVTNEVTECKIVALASGSAGPQTCDAYYTYNMKFRFRGGKIYEETSSMSRRGNSPVISADTAKADSGLVYVLGQDLDLIKHPELSSYWRTVPGVTVENLQVSATIRGNILTLSLRSKGQQQADSLGQTYGIDSDQVLVKEFSLVGQKCQMRPLIWTIATRMSVIKHGIGVGLLLNGVMDNSRTSIEYRTTSSVCRIE